MPNYSLSTCRSIYNTENTLVALAEFTPSLTSGFAPMSFHTAPPGFGDFVAADGSTLFPSQNPGLTRIPATQSTTDFSREKVTLEILLKPDQPGSDPLENRLLRMINRAVINLTPVNIYHIVLDTSHTQVEPATLVFAGRVVNSTYRATQQSSRLLIEVGHLLYDFDKTTTVLTTPESYDVYLRENDLNDAVSAMDFNNRVFNNLWGKEA